jgi:hypothetical protein
VFPIAFGGVVHRSFGRSPVDPLGEVVDVLLGEFDSLGEAIHQFQVVELRFDRLARDVAPVNFRVVVHPPFGVFVDRKGETRHGRDYVYTREAVFRLTSYVRGARMRARTSIREGEVDQ